MVAYYGSSEVWDLALRALAASRLPRRRKPLGLLRGESPSISTPSMALATALISLDMEAVRSIPAGDAERVRSM